MYNPPISGKPSIQHGHEMRRFAEQDADVDPMAYPSPYNNGLKPKRDHRGNLPGGKQNGELQKYQMCETLEVENTTVCGRMRGHSQPPKIAKILP